LALGKGFDVRVFDPDVFPMSIQGPKSADLLSRVLGDSIRELKFFRFVETEIAGTPVVVARTGWSGQGGYEIYLQEPDAGVTLWDTLAAAGEDLQVRAGCPNLIERIESGLLSFGNDMTLANNPLEAGLDRFFKLGKSADYLGRAALEAIAEEGVKNRLVKLVIEGEPIANPRTVYTVQGESGENIGTVTSAVYSPRLCCNIGLGYLPVSYCDEGKAAIVLTPQGPRELRIANNDWSS
jgi:glycine cleavage system aminomethyltransferase T